ncbi:cytochrome c biogenesis protein ResB [Arthrobacter sp. MYb211]|uniref:cytochrome c biogenesis protein ResB n=1 Tax=Micrococcaceae TaxID=1268 RepID=UPI000BB98173|nr:MULTISPECIES: cytochrome c biogenesis protein ResB [Micrococcaceae]PCC30135.1 cytochrome C biogenesis protein ResB [Glutamicibacter sp. BW80]PQZ99548.1 cytochrome c biogenesis protein ResB [Arthrobacter sp. MYb224]PRA05986.1 cytochrome c biogenesis protein ResB [Arthrobacter sp. MYb229]PRA11243.1 cytochrome c biogenesis protein ResB [Arthrobacter sp. MYb221]PRB52888.1 cytochrome c biogenesis protein ResB [Arthrobacter sp. MYb216]
MAKNKRTGKDRGDAPALGFLGSLRWIWTQLTSMPTALFLLLLLAVAAVPGSIFPQRSMNPETVNEYLEQNPATGPWLDRFQLFDVYSSAWFSAIYILLFVSLVGCIIPRVKKHAQALRTPPPRTPARLDRLPQYTSLSLVEDEADTPSDDEVIDDAYKVLRKRGYRVERRSDATGRSVAAERGYTREIGNLTFHISLIGVLVSVAIGGAFGYAGQRVIVEGETFVNSLVSYDSFTPGTSFNPENLTAYSVKLDKFDIVFDRESKTHFGQPLDFTAHVETRRSADAEPVKEELKVNHPLRINGADVYLVGNGYAPVVTVRDGNGDVSFSGPVVSVPQDSVYTSLMVIKAPDAKPEQLGFQGFLLPTALVDETGFGISGDPNAINPQLHLNSFAGNLGLDDGVPQNVYVLDTENLTEVNSRNLDSGGIVLEAGQTYDLPDGKGSIAFDDLKRFIAVDVNYDPSKTPILIFAFLSLAGLAVSLFTPRRRVWVKLKNEDGQRSIEYALLARGEDPRLERESAELHNIFDSKWPVASQKQDQGEVNA